jgi:hypothetical protein
VKGPPLALNPEAARNIVRWMLDIPAALVVNHRDLPTSELVGVESRRNGRDRHAGQ